LTKKLNIIILYNILKKYKIERNFKFIFKNISYILFNFILFNLFNIVLREGRGIEKYADGDSYDGEYKNGKK
jgi:hypothetical protein